MAGAGTKVLDTLGVSPADLEPATAAGSAFEAAAEPATPPDGRTTIGRIRTPRPVHAASLAAWAHRAAVLGLPTCVIVGRGFLFPSRGGTITSRCSSWRQRRGVGRAAALAVEVLPGSMLRWRA